MFYGTQLEYFHPGAGLVKINAITEDKEVGLTRVMDIYVTNHREKDELGNSITEIVEIKQYDCK